jgi:probable F420-dependent oxidoreductase
VEGQAPGGRALRVGLALPQYEVAVPGAPPVTWPGTVRAARRAEELGFDSVWVSDHLFLGMGRYGPGPGQWHCLDPLAALGALARHTSRVRLGTLTLSAPLRPATVVAKSLATLDVVCGGRLVVGLGAGWYEPELAEVGAAGERPGRRLARLAEAVEVIRGMAGGGPFSYEGRHERAVGAHCAPRPVQRPAPPIWLGGSGDRLLGLAGRIADGWNTGWWSTPEAYARRVEVLHAACERHGRDPASVELSVALAALVGEDHADLARRLELLRRVLPPGALPDATLDDLRRDGLVGTVDEVGEKVAAWAAVGVSSLIVTVGPAPFTVAGDIDIETIAAACSLDPCPTLDPWS